MTEESKLRTPQMMTTELDISPATLRRWSDEFADYLSPEASSSQGRSHRRFSNDDLATLKTVKELMGQGMTYEQVRQILADQLDIWTDRISRMPNEDEPEEEDLPASETSEEVSLITTNGSDSTAFEFITNTLTTLSDSQKSVLNSQAANRELLGVLLQDNFNLKEENNRLRERIIDVERNLAQARQEDEWRRESLRQELDGKIMLAQQTANEAILAASAPQEPAEIKAVKSKSGCLGSLFGLGDIKIVSLPRRGRQQDATPESAPPVMPPAAGSPPVATGPVQPPAAHPKPTLPPE